MSVRQIRLPKLTVPGPGAFLLVAVVIAAGAVGGLEMSRKLGGLPTIWLSDGIMLAILLGVRTWHWPAYLLAGFAGNVAAMLMLRYPADLMLEFPLANFLGTAAAAVYLQGHITTVSDLSRLPLLLRFMLFAGGVAPFLTACVNTLILYLHHATLGLGFVTSDFLSHAIGFTTVTPAVLAAREQSLGKFLGSGRIRLGILTAILMLGTAVGVFAQTRYPLLFMVYPPLVLVVCLFRLPGGALALCAVTLISVGFSRAGHGPSALIRQELPVERAILLQVFTGEAAFLVLGLAAILGDLDRAREQLSAAKEALALLAITDALTGLANRRRLDEVLEQECRRAARNRTSLALLLIDVDNFKAYNDHYGHQAGDECLRAIASTISGITRAGDLTARYGGEELVVLLAGISHPAAVARAEQIRLSIERMALRHAGNPDHGGIITVSIGVSSHDPALPHCEPEALLFRADKMLYEAKRTGRNKAVAITLGALPTAAST